MSNRSYKQMKRKLANEANAKRNAELPPMDDSMKEALKALNPNRVRYGSDIPKGMCSCIEPEIEVEKGHFNCGGAYLCLCIVCGKIVKMGEENYNFKEIV